MSLVLDVVSQYIKFLQVSQNMMHMMSHKEPLGYIFCIKRQEFNWICFQGKYVACDELHTTRYACIMTYQSNKLP